MLLPLPLTVSCFSKIQIGFTFLVRAHPGSPGKRAVKWVSVSLVMPCKMGKVLTQSYMAKWSLNFCSCMCMGAVLSCFVKCM